MAGAACPAGCRQGQGKMDWLAGAGGKCKVGGGTGAHGRRNKAGRAVNERAYGAGNQGHKKGR